MARPPKSDHCNRLAVRPIGDEPFGENLLSGSVPPVTESLLFREFFYSNPRDSYDRVSYLTARLNEPCRLMHINCLFQGERTDMSDGSSESENGKEKSFAELYESFNTGMNENIRVGERISGKIISIGRDAVFVDTGTKTDGVVEKGELLDEKGELSYKEGDTLDLYVVSVHSGEVRLSRGLSGLGSTAALRMAFEKSVPLDGKVKGLIKGGFHVEVMQKRAFCPMGQMDLNFVERPEEYVGKTYLFLITEFEESGKNVVVSRRELLKREQEKARAAFCEGIDIGAQLEGRVTKVMPYGAFVELFPGVEGMVHISELSWSKVEKPDEAVKKDDRVAVKVIGIEKGAKSGHMRVSLSMKQVTGDPWESLEGKFREGDKVMGRVRRLANFGAFVEIAPGIEGLVHLSEMSYTKRVLNPEEIVKSGESVQVVVKEIDLSKRRIALSIKDAEGDPWADVKERYHVNQCLEGTLQKKEKFGWFVTLEPGVTGLIPKSRLWNSQAQGSFDKLREGDLVNVIVEEVKPEERRITLGPVDSKDEGDWRSFAKGEGSLGSLGEKLRNALQSKKGS